MTQGTPWPHDRRRTKKWCDVGGVQYLSGLRAWTGQVETLRPRVLGRGPFCPSSARNGVKGDVVGTPGTDSPVGEEDVDEEGSEEGPTPWDEIRLEVEGQWASYSGSGGWTNHTSVPENPPVLPMHSSDPTCGLSCTTHLFLGRHFDGSGPQDTPSDSSVYVRTGRILLPLIRGFAL